MNAKAGDIEPLLSKPMDSIKEIYNNFIKNPVHHLW